MPISCFSSSAPASQNGSCFGALLKACKRSRSESWDASRVDEFEKNPNFKKTSEDEFHKLYKIKRTVGVGGFSVVKKGKHIPTGQDVAIKVIDRSKYDPNDGSLEAEIVVLDKVHHPYCISFKECYFTRKHVYVITELVTGGELLDRVINHGKYKEQKAARIMKQLLEGVAYLHSIGVTHRDLKLENILLKSRDEDSSIKIADFGLSKIFAGAAPLTTICGSPQYVAPEVLEVGHNRLCYTPAADLWSTGVIMYILLSGHSPFDDPNEAILFQKIKKGSYSMKQPVWDTVSYEGKDLMKHLLVTMPEKRYTAKQALQHQWFKIMVRDETPEEELSMGTVDNPEEFEEHTGEQRNSSEPQEITQTIETVVTTNTESLQLQLGQIEAAPTEVINEHPLATQQPVLALPNVSLILPSYNNNSSESTGSAIPSEGPVQQNLVDHTVRSMEDDTSLQMQQEENADGRETDTAALAIGGLELMRAVLAETGKTLELAVVEEVSELEPETVD